MRPGRQKENTFDDFVSTAVLLLDQCYTRHALSAGDGRTVDRGVQLRLNNLSRDKARLHLPGQVDNRWWAGKDDEIRDGDFS